MTTRDTLLLADDMVSNRVFLGKLFEDEFNILEAEDGEQAMEVMAANHSTIAAVLLDLIMPGKDGFQVLAEMREQGYLDEIPVIVVTSDSSQKSEARALEMGALDLVAKPYDPYVVRRRVQNLVELKRNRDQLARQVGEMSAAMDITNDTVVNTLATITEFRSLESGQHIFRIRKFTEILLEEVAQSFPEYELDRKKIATISSASALHDIGKISIPDAILNKPGKLTREEFEAMKAHTTDGCRILDGMTQVVDREYMRYAYNICRYHHERWDGRGYPDGLQGENIPICAQVVSIADVYDALTTKRVYKGAIPHEETMNMILNGECGTFNPRLLECFKQVSGEFALCAKAYVDGAIASAEDLHEPLPKPKPVSAGLNTQQMATIKYHTLLNYINGLVLEVDMDNDTYHMIYDSSKMFPSLRNDGSFSGAIRQLIEVFVHPRDRDYVRQGVSYLQKDFFDEGLRRYRQKFRIHIGEEPDHYVWVDSTTLRLDVGGPNIQKCLLVWKESATTPGAQKSILSPRPETWGEKALRDMAGLVLRCRNDRWQTVAEGGDQLAALLGYSEEELRDIYQNRFLDIVLPEDREALMSHVNKQLSQASTVAVEYRLLGNDGHIIWVKDQAFVYVADDGMEYACHAIMDNTYLQEAMDQLRSVQERHHILLGQIDEITFEWDVRKDRISFSSNFKKQLGYEPGSEAFSQRILDGTVGIHPEDLPFLQDLTQAIRDGHEFSNYVTMDIRVRKADGAYVWRQLRACVQQMENGKTECFVGALINIDQEKHEELDAKDKTEKDNLTKLFNRQAAIQRARQSLAERRAGEYSALLLIDLDHFREVNRRYGRMAGDAVLTQCAEFLQEFFRREDILARIGGDEFMVLVRSVTSESLLFDQCQRFVNALTSYLARDLPDSSVSCSIGIAIAPGDGDTYEELFHRATHALFSAKAGDDGNIAFFQSGEQTPGDMLEESPIESDSLSGMAEQGLIFYAFNKLYQSSNVEEIIYSILEMAGRQMNVSRVYIFENNSDGHACGNTFQWCSEGIPPYQDEMQRLNYKRDLPDWYTHFNDQGVFLCENVAEMPDEYRVLLEPLEIKSMLLCSIMDGDEIWGLVGMDECRMDRTWTREQVDVLTMVAKVATAFLVKRRERPAGDPLAAAESPCQ